MKQAYIILAFHAHEPLWDLPNELIALVDDPEMHDAIRGENHLLKRAKERRDIYATLINTATALGAPVSLDASNELLIQLAWYLPDTFQNLLNAYKNGTVYPLYTHAHHTHAALLTPDEIADEVRLNMDLLHRVMGIPEPRYKGVFPTEGSMDAAKLSAYKDCGMEFVIMDELNPRKVNFTVEGEGDTAHKPFLLNQDLIALPRDFTVSQYVWRPITQYKAKELIYQGYILGKYWVFEEEYRKKAGIPFPISWEEAAAQYTGILEKALTELPDQGLIFYIQDLELMDFGDIELKLLEEAWKRVIVKNIAEVHFVTPDTYLDTLKDKADLPRVHFHQVSWAPEIRVLLRYDGHYPPREAGEYNGLDSTTGIFKPLPFAFWEPGRFIKDIFGAVINAFGMPRILLPYASALRDTNYAMPRFDIKDQVAILHRFLKRADNWGWQPDEGLQKRPFLDGYRIAQLLSGAAAEDIAFAATRYVHPGDVAFNGSERILEFVLDSRVGYLKTGIIDKGLAGDKKDPALLELKRVEGHRVIASEFISRALESSQSIEQLTNTGQKGEALLRLLRELKGYCREAFVATDHIQRAWGYINNIEEMILTMYQYLYNIYPPKFPLIFQELLPGEWQERQDPKKV